jgi:16S rRNA processing protein RimM
LTVRVPSGDAERWAEVTEVLVARGDEVMGYEVEKARAYRDRLVLKLAGVDDAGQAAALRGRIVMVPAAQVAPLPPGRYYLDRLIGMEMIEENGTVVGRVEDVLEAGGNEVLVAVDGDGRECLVPLVREYVVDVDETTNTMKVRLPEALRRLNDEDAELDGGGR